MSGDEITTTRDCEVVEIPGGQTHNLVKGTAVSITQSLGGSYTLLVPAHGGLFRLSGRDADAIGKEAVEEVSNDDDIDLSTKEQLENEIWTQLKTCFDPEIPVNIVDLGLIYGLKVSSLDDGKSHVDVQMTLTAQGCGMGESIASDAQEKIQRITKVSTADVKLVWEPPWTPDKISEEGKVMLGMG